MEYDDRFHPQEGNDIEDADLYFRNATTLQNIKALDPRFYKYKKCVFLKNEDGRISKKNITIEYYFSGPSGTYIRNAQTGFYTKDVVGTKEEDLYFKINVCNGNSHTLFYDSPEQYERHHLEKLSTGIKENWLKKRTPFDKIESIKATDTNK
jgi:hypothetical protein